MSDGQNNSNLDEKYNNLIDYMSQKFHIDITKFIIPIKQSNFYNRDDVIDKNDIYDLICPICLNILKNPMSCSLNNSSHSFCKECIDLYLKEKNGCPICKNAFEYKNNINIIKLLNNVTFKCKYSEEGCNKIISYADYLEHINKCEYKNKNVLYKCIVQKYNYNNKAFEDCLFVGNIKDIEIHIQNCAIIKYNCIFCKLNILMINLKNHAEKECKVRIINYEKEINI